MNFTPEETAAIQKLCSDSSVAREALGENTREMPPDWYVADGSPNADYRHRLHAYTSRLRGYLVSMAAELDELPEDAPRLRSEAVGILLALRDVEHQFPEALR
jgi:hypothetical protein